jgi:tyrosine-protein phosphatase SIW14
MFKIRLLPALGLACMALFAIAQAQAQAQADETTSLRSPEWAQPVGNQFNLHQMTPTL